MNTTSVETAFPRELEHIREVCKEGGCFSWTSREYQFDVLNFVYENHANGVGLIEVGCYKGGLSALFAFLCQRFEWPFYTMDIDPTAIESTKGILSRLGLAQHSTVHHGTLSSFVSTVAVRDRAVLVNLDGDHAYPAVINDIESVHRLNP